MVKPRTAGGFHGDCPSHAGFWSARIWRTSLMRRRFWPHDVTSRTWNCRNWKSAIERVIAGPEPQNAHDLGTRKRRSSPHHESGHAHCGQVNARNGPGAQDLHHFPRPGTGLYPCSFPTEDRYLTSKTEIKNRLSVLLGGRVAEELVFSEITTGASRMICNQSHRNGDQNGVRVWNVRRKWVRVDLPEKRRRGFSGPRSEPRAAALIRMIRPG